MIVFLMLFTCISLGRCEIFWIEPLTDLLEEGVEEIEEYVEDRIEEYYDRF